MPRFGTTGSAKQKIGIPPVNVRYTDCALRSYIVFNKNLFLFNLYQRIAENGHQAARGDAGGEDAAEPVGEVREDLRHKLHTQATGKAEGHDQGGLARNGLRGDDADTGRGHRAEHEQRGAAQHGFGHEREHAPHGREEAQQHEHGGNEIAYVATGHAGELNHAVVLRKNGIGEGVEQTGQHGVEAVGQDAARGAAHEHGTLDGLAGDERIGGDVAVGLDGRNQVNEAQRDNGAAVKAEPVAQGHGYVEPAIAGHVGKVDVAHQPRGHVAHHQPDDDGAHAQVAIAAAVEGNDDEQYAARERQVVERAKRAVGQRRLPAPAGRDAHLDEAQTNKGDHNAGHKRGDDAPHVLEHAADGHLDTRGGHAGSEHGAQSARHAGGNDGADEGEAGALHAEEARADGPDAATLNKGGHAGGKQGHGDEEAGGFEVEPQSAGYDERRSDDGHKNGQQMLQGGKQGLAKGGTVVQPVDEAAGRGVGSIHKSEKINPKKGKQSG